MFLVQISNFNLTTFCCIFENGRSDFGSPLAPKGIHIFRYGDERSPCGDGRAAGTRAQGECETRAPSSAAPAFARACEAPAPSAAATLQLGLRGRVQFAALPAARAPSRAAGICTSAQRSLGPPCLRSTRPVFVMHVRTLTVRVGNRYVGAEGHGVVRTETLNPKPLTVRAGMLGQKLMGMASAPGNIVAALGRPLHMVSSFYSARDSDFYLLALPSSLELTLLHFLYLLYLLLIH
jgi:hypothetical protein